MSYICYELFLSFILQPASDFSKLLPGCRMTSRDDDDDDDRSGDSGLDIYIPPLTPAAVYNSK